MTFSYLVSVPPPADLGLDAGGPAAQQYAVNSANFFTLHFTHDWCWSDGAVRCSGEDHFSALKPPRDGQRNANLARWTRENYPGVWPAAAASSAAS